MYIQTKIYQQPVEITQSEKSYNIMVELPGSTRDEIKVWLEKGLLTITGEKKPQAGEKIFSERVFGKFSRLFRLPEDADLDNIEANYRDGVVSVEIAKLEEAKPKSINIK